MNIINADLFLSLMILGGHIDEAKCADLRKIVEQCKIAAPEQREAVETIKCLENIKKGLAQWNPDKYLNEAIKAVETATYYHDLAKSYEKTIVKLNDALRFNDNEKKEDHEHRNFTLAEEILLDQIERLQGNKQMQAIALQTFIQTVGPVSNECGELIKKYME